MCPWATHSSYQLNPSPIPHYFFQIQNLAKCCIYNPLQQLSFSSTAPESHTPLALLTHQMSVHAPVPLGNALNPPLAISISKPLTWPAIPVPLLIPLASTDVNAVLIPDFTSALLGKISDLFKLPTLLTLHSDTTWY